MAGEKTRVQQALAALESFRDEVDAAGLGAEFEPNLAAARQALTALQAQVESAREERADAFYYEVTT